MLSSSQLYCICDIKKVDTYLSELKDFSGGVCITQDNKVLLKKNCGYENRELKIYNNSSTKFPIASNTKSFTAVAIVLLQEKRLLNIEDKLNKYIAGFPDNITIHHLLTHSSGIPNYYKYWDEIKDVTDLEQIINIIKTWKLDFEPGSSYRYSNSGYLLLAYIVEKVTGNSVEDFLSQNIFKRLNMRNSGSIINKSIIERKALGYIKNNGLIIDSPSITNPLTLLGNGDLHSSIDDMIVWLNALFSGKIITKENLDLILKPHIATETTNNRFHGYGWFLENKNGKLVAEYSGALVGYLSKVVRFIDDNISLIILTNVEDQEQFLNVCDDVSNFIQETSLK